MIIYIVRSNLDPHCGKSYLKMFGDLNDATKYRREILDKYEIPEHLNGLVFIEEGTVQGTNRS